MLYDELVSLIDSKNKIYKELNDSIYSAKTEEECKQASTVKSTLFMFTLRNYTISYGVGSQS